MSLEAVGAFLAGVGSVVGAFWTVNRVKKHDREECDRELELFKEGLKWEQSDDSESSRR